ncbi:ATPase family AAA domain-containing protein 3 [Colletotrichum siamense]|nr:ATPase family AAA domain-containing protein 3 [Colletotrichum siamense]
MNQLQHRGTSEPASRALLDPRAHLLTGSDDTTDTAWAFSSSSNSYDLSTGITWVGNSNLYSHWYTNSVQQQSFNPAKHAYDRAVEILRKELTAAERRVIRLEEHNSIEDVRAALDKALEEYKKKAKSSEVRELLAECSSRVMYYGAVFDTFSQHHPEYVSLAWGAFKFLFIAILNYEELLVEVSKAVSRIGDVLPRAELHVLLYPTPRMQETVAQLYSKILEFSVMAIRFYKKGKLSHAIASVVKPFSLTFKPIIEEIRQRSLRVDELANALSKAEMRDLHVKIHGLSHSVARLTEMMALQSQSILSLQTQNKHMFQNMQIDAIRSAVLIADTPVAADSLDWCRSMRNRRRQKAFTQLPLPEISKLKLWVSDSSSSLLLAQGRGVATSALDFAADFIDIVIDHDYPVIWALPSIIFDSKQHLNLDVLDQSRETSNFIAYLLDTIQMLEAEVNYKEADYESDVSEPGSHEGNIPSVPVNEPVSRKKSSASVEIRIEGRKEIGNLTSYLVKHPELYFIVIKEHTCVRGSAGGSSDAMNRISQRSERLAIVSPVLQKALGQIAQYALESNHSIIDSGIAMDAPYPFLFHHRERLIELAEENSYQSAISPLLGFLNDNYEDEYQEANRMFDQGVVSAYHLQKLFQPNQLVIENISDKLNVYALEDAPLISKDEMAFTGWSYSYADVDLQRKGWTTTVSSIGNETVRISSLIVHPIRFARNEDLEKLIRRGQTFWKMKGQQYTCYTGWDHQHEHYYSSARFMVDLATHHLMHPKKLETVAQRRHPKNHPVHHWPKRIRWDDELTPETIMLLPSTVYGFNLQEKKWVDLDVDKFHNEVTWNKSAFNRLVLKPEIKEMIYALVDIQTATKKMDDIITGKGNGLIVLLHGSPGTGKTLTAESVAEIAEKPLYRVTCGDIGTEAQDVENYLSTVLYLGKLWDCVLLLDEADVFLEERTFADLQRNSLVSVFLRILEYYEGILILTSNRVGHFDEAFKSRIQVAIHYENLSKSSRKAIWVNFFDMIEKSADEDANIAELEDHLDQLASEEMNGRQIRNAILTARQLAKHRKERLEWVHLDQVMKTSAAFNKYLKTVRGQSDDKIAREEGRR